MRYLGRIGAICETERKSEELSVQWDIRNFFSLSGKGEDFYYSPDFKFSNARWCLQMDTNGETRNPPSGFVDLFLLRKDPGPPVTIQFTLCISGAKGVERRGELVYEFTKNNPGFGFGSFFPRDVLRDHQSILMPNGVMTVKCIMKTVVPSCSRSLLSYQDTSTQTEVASTESSACTCGSQSLNKQETSTQTDNNLEAEVVTQAQKSSDKQGIEKVVEDIGKLLASGEDSDVTVQVGDVEFKVHRAILSARCPVLSAMFRHETAERASNRISISDCEPEVFKQYLHYVYSGSTEPLSEQIVFGLYRVADKYLADDLKQHCLQHIQVTLSAQTFCEAVKLALTHGESGLLQLAIDFASKNLPLIICTVEWQKFNCEYPIEANEILVKCICPRS